MTKANIVLAAAAVLFGAGCFVLFQDTVALRHRVRTLEAQLAELHCETPADTTASQPVEFEPAAPSTEQPAPAAAVPVVQSSTPVAAKPTPAAKEEWRAVLADPEYRRARMAEARLELEREYPRLAAELGLSADEAERFFDLLGEQRVREHELAVKNAPGEDPLESQKKLQAQAEEERRAFLGDRRFDTWVEYVKSIPARAFVDDLRTQLATTVAPLREEQVKPLVKVLANEHERHTEERRANYEAEISANGQWSETTSATQQIAYMERRAALIEQSLDRQREAGEMYLDPVQRREFNAMLDRRREQARAELDMFQAQMEAIERTRSRSR